MGPTSLGPPEDQLNPYGFQQGFCVEENLHPTPSPSRSSHHLTSSALLSNMYCFSMPPVSGSSADMSIVSNVCSNQKAMATCLRGSKEGSCAVVACPQVQLPQTSHSPKDCLHPLTSSMSVNSPSVFYSSSSSSSSPTTSLSFCSSSVHLSSAPLHTPPLSRTGHDAIANGRLQQPDLHGSLPVALKQEPGDEFPACNQALFHLKHQEDRGRAHLSQEPKRRAPYPSLPSPHKHRHSHQCPPIDLKDHLARTSRHPEEPQGQARVASGGEGGEGCASSQGDEQTCQWLDCCAAYKQTEELVRHIEKVHVDQRKGEDFTCFWAGCVRRYKPFNARYKLLIHMRVHSGEKPNKCMVSWAQRRAQKTQLNPLPFALGVGLERSLFTISCYSSQAQSASVCAITYRWRRESNRQTQCGDCHTLDPLFRHDILLT